MPEDKHSVYDSICDLGVRDLLNYRPATYRQFTDSFADWAYQLGRREGIIVIGSKSESGVSWFQIHGILR